MQLAKSFYVYIYLDPRKAGFYKYDEYQFEYEPFYVGKGQETSKITKGRMYDHLYDAITSSKKTFKLNKIRKILIENLEPSILNIKGDLSELDSFELEKRLISLIGRYDLGKGPLTNKTNGGEGTSGIIYTKEQLENYSKIQKILNNDPIRKEKKRKEMVELWKDPLFRQITIKKIKDAQNDPRTKELHSKRSKEKWKDPIYRENVIKSLIGNTPGTIKRWEITFPSEQKLEIKNLFKFCEEHDLSYSIMKELSYNNSIYNGYKCKCLSTPESPELIEKRKNASAAEWIVIDSNKNSLKIKNLSEFCRKNELNPDLLSYYSKKGKSYNGWTCRKIS